MTKLAPIVLFAAAVLTTACALSSPSSTSFTPVVTLETAYVVTGSTSAGPFDAELMFFDAGAITIAGTIQCGGSATGEYVDIKGKSYSQAEVPPTRIRRVGDAIRISCSRAQLALERMPGGSLEGVVSVLVQEKDTRRGPCKEWEVDPRTGRRVACVQWEWIETERSVWSPEFPLHVSVRRNPSSV